MAKASHIFTIGYESASVEDFIATLAAAGVRQIIDVRDVPLSRKKGFSKNALQAILEAHDISYVHLKGLGDPKPGRDAARAGDYAAFRRIFAKHMQSKAAQADLETAMQLAADAASCLMCYERKPEECHRTIVAQAITEQTGLKVKPLGVRQGLSDHDFDQRRYA